MFILAANFLKHLFICGWPMRADGKYSARKRENSEVSAGSSIMEFHPASVSASVRRVSLEDLRSLKTSCFWVLWCRHWLSSLLGVRGGVGRTQAVQVCVSPVWSFAHSNLSISVWVVSPVRASAALWQHQQPCRWRPWEGPLGAGAGSLGCLLGEHGV